MDVNMIRSSIMRSTAKLMKRQITSGSTVTATFPPPATAVESCLDDEEFSLLSCNLMSPSETVMSNEPSTPITLTLPLAVLICHGRREK